MKIQAIFLVTLMLVISTVLSGCTEQTKINNNITNETAGANISQNNTSSSPQDDTTIIDSIFGFFIHNPNDKFIGTWNTTSNSLGLKEIELTFFNNESYKIKTISDENFWKYDENGQKIDENLITNISWGIYHIYEIDDTRGDLKLENLTHELKHEILTTYYFSYSFHFNKILFLIPLATTFAVTLCFHKK